MKTTESQNARIYAYLKRGSKLTGLLALRLFGTMCLPKRISEVQMVYGISVDREMIEVKSGHGLKRIMEYQLKPKRNGKNSNNIGV